MQHARPQPRTSARERQHHGRRAGRDGPIPHRIAQAGRRPAEAEDLALETFLRLYQRLPIEEKDFQLGGWLYRVATNLGLRSIRSFKRREHYEITAGKYALDDAPETRPTEMFAQKEESALARQALAQMNERQSQLLVLRYSGLPYKEIASALHLSPTSIGPLLLRAEREFEACYRALAQEEE